MSGRQHSCYQLDDPSFLWFYESEFNHIKCYVGRLSYGLTVIDEHVITHRTTLVQLLSFFRNSGQNHFPYLCSMPYTVYVHDEMYDVE